jgi:adenosylcobinamide-phosphate synthase
MALAIATGWVLDRLLGDPARWHPVAGFGLLAAALERRCWRPSRAAGTLFAGGMIAATALATRAIDRTLLPWRHARFAFRSIVIWTTLGGRSLDTAATRLAVHVEAGDLAAARALAPTLVGRDPTMLDAPELCRAAVESVAENASDAVVAPLFWAAALGAPGAAAYRAVNTLNAMVGHRSDRHREFGWAAARADDLANWPPARLAAVSAALLAPVVGGRTRRAWRAAFVDGRAHPSPNAGVVEGAFAGALSVRLGGLNHYGHGSEWRATLGTGRSPAVEDIARAVKLARAVEVTAAAACVALARRIAT